MVMMNPDDIFGKLNPFTTQGHYDLEKLFAGKSMPSNFESDRGSSGDWNDMSEFRSVQGHTPAKQF